MDLCLCPIQALQRQRLHRFRLSDLSLVDAQLLGEFDGSSNASLVFGVHRVSEFLLAILSSCLFFLSHNRITSSMSIHSLVELVSRSASLFVLVSSLLDSRREQGNNVARDNTQRSHHHYPVAQRESMHERLHPKTSKTALCEKTL